jgi:hypothetical protein
VLISLVKVGLWFQRSYFDAHNSSFIIGSESQVRLETAVRRCCRKRMPGIQQEILTAWAGFRGVGLVKRVARPRTELPGLAKCSAQGCCFFWKSATIPVVGLLNQVVRDLLFVPHLLDHHSPSRPEPRPLSQAILKENCGSQSALRR